MSIPFVPGATVAVPEIPYRDEVRLPAAQTAVVVADMQNDFVRPDGLLCVPSAAATVPHIARLLAAARACGVRIAYIQDTHVEADPEFRIWPDHCLQGSWGWQIVDELQPQPADARCQKNRYDGFYDTWLDHFLTRAWRVEHLVIVGTVANICVLQTAASAALRWFDVVVPADGISAFTEFDQAATLRQVTGPLAGSVVRSVADVKFEA